MDGQRRDDRESTCLGETGGSLGYHPLLQRIKEMLDSSDDEMADLGMALLAANISDISFEDVFPKRIESAQGYDITRYYIIEGQRGVGKTNKVEYVLSNKPLTKRQIEHLSGFLKITYL